VTLVDYKVTSNGDTVESQVNAARDERDRLALWSRVLPITFTAIGVIALVGGGLLASFSFAHRECADRPGIGPRDEEFFGRSGSKRGPGAEAETEKLPTQRPEYRQDPSSPGSDPPDSGEPPDSGPPDPSVRPAERG